MIIESILNILNLDTKLNIKSNINSNIDSSTKSYTKSNINKTQIYNNINNSKSFIDFLLNKDFYIYIIFFVIFILTLTTINLGILIICLNSNKKIMKLLKNNNF